MKTKLSLSIAALVALSIVSCQKEEELTPQVFTPERVEVTLNGGVGVTETKVSYTPVEGVRYDFAWTANDLLNLIVNGTTGNENNQFTATTAAECSPLTGTVSTWEGAKNIYSVYPYNTTAYTISGGENAETATVALSMARQTVAAGDGTGKYANTYMTASVADVAQSNLPSVLLNYKQVMSIIKMNITNVPAGERVTAVRIESNFDMPEAAEVTLFTGDVSSVTRTTRSLTAMVTGATAGAATIVDFAMFPFFFEAPNYLNFYVETTDGSNVMRNYLVKSFGETKDFQRNNIYTSTLNMSGISPITKNLSVNGTANCYIVPVAGNYQIDATVIGNGTAGLLGGDIATTKFHTYSAVISPSRAELLWEDVSGLITNITLSEGVLSFTASAAEGNALIAVKDADGNILWSWHIWCTDTPEDHTYVNAASKQFTVMDRNLGATSATAGDASLGLFYQWGRKDPFKRDNTVYFSATDAEKGTIAYTIAHPITYLTAGDASASDWYYVDGNDDSDYNDYQDRNNYLWGNPTGYTPGDDAQKSIYDPCPNGYMVAPMYTWTGFETSSGSSTPKFSGSWSTGYNFLYNGTDSAWYPAAGYRGGSSGARYDTGNNGYYWSSSPSSNYAYYAGFLYFANSNVNPLYSSVRANGSSVRCVRN